MKKIAVSIIFIICLMIVGVTISMFSRDNSKDEKKDLVNQFTGQWHSNDSEPVSSIEITEQKDSVIFTVDGQKYATTLTETEKGHFIFQTSGKDQFNRIVLSDFSDDEMVVMVAAIDNKQSPGVSRPIKYYRLS